MVVGCWLLFVVCCLLLVVCCLLFGVCCFLFVVGCCLLFVVCCWLFVACESLRSLCEISISQCASGGGLAHIEAKKIGKSSIRCIFRLENCRLSVSILSIFVESEIAKPLFSSIRRTAFHYKTAGAILFRGGPPLTCGPEKISKCCILLTATDDVR